MFGHYRPQCLSWSWKTAVEQSPNTRQQEWAESPGEGKKLINPQRDFCSWKELICTKSLWFSLLGWVRAQSTFGNRAQKQLPGQSSVSLINTQNSLWVGSWRNHASTTPENKITAIPNPDPIYRIIAFEESVYIQNTEISNLFPEPWWFLCPQWPFKYSGYVFWSQTDFGWNLSFCFQVNKVEMILKPI